MSDHAADGKVVAATRALALLNEQADGLRAELVKLRQNLAEVQRDFDGTRTAELRESNEQLVLAALHADTIAETAVRNLVELTRASQRDALTDTPNRALMLDRLEIAITAARRRRAHIAVLFLDIDHFKQINDSLGHAVGDEVLQLVARRLESIVRDSDTVSRHSGDEFLVLLAEISQASDAALIAAKMLSALAEPSHVGDHVLCLSASIGIAIYPQDGEDAPTLIRRADAAMYRSKNHELGSFEFYSGERMSDASLGLPTFDVMQQSVMSHELALAAHESRVRDLRAANEQLVIAALTAQELEAQAEAAHHRQITFQAMVAHELRNPLTPIRMAAELLNHDRADGPTLAKLQVIIRRQVTHMAKLIDDLLDGSRLSAGKFRLECRPVEMADIFDQAVETCRPAMELRLQRFTMQLPSSGPLDVYGDPVRLSQVFSNLLSNASKYTPHGGEISLSVKLLDHAMVITVSDDGIGISAEALPNIFDLFIQDPGALALYNGGLGIGLAVVRELVEAHGGTVVGKSAGKNLGSEFVVTLPMPDKQAETPAV
jgi:diguanylate cyclase (GGDEF)-like protein